MTLTPIQRTGIFILMQHLSERGMESVQEMRMVRTIRTRMNVQSEHVRKAHQGLKFDLDPIDADLTDGEVALIRSAVQWREESLRQNDQKIPKWLAAVDEAVRPESQHSRSPLMKDVKDPFSVATNVVFALAGVLMVLLAPRLETLLGAACFGVLGVGSTIGHLRRTASAWTEDVQAMYLSFAALAGMAWTPEYDAAMAVAMTVGGVLVFAENWLESFVVMPILVLCSIVALPAWPAASILSAFLLAVGIRQYGIDRGRPTSDYVHAVWHVLTASASVAVIFFAFA